MARKNIEINGKKFEVKNNIGEGLGMYNSLYDCYDRPSSAKIRIDNDWRRFFDEVDLSNTYTISGYNCMMFSIKCRFTFEGVDYIAYITPSHNYIMEV